MMVPQPGRLQVPGTDVPGTCSPGGLLLVMTMPSGVSHAFLFFSPQIGKEKRR
jgi:hypothetical protein